MVKVKKAAPAATAAKAPATQSELMSRRLSKPSTSEPTAAATKPVSKDKQFQVVAGSKKGTFAVLNILTGKNVTNNQLLAVARKEAARLNVDIPKAAAEAKSKLTAPAKTGFPVVPGTPLVPAKVKAGAAGKATAKAAVKAPAKATTTSGKEKTKRVPLHEAVAQVLAKASNKPMTCDELAEKVTATGLLKKTVLANSIWVALDRDRRKAKPRKFMDHPADGTWSLRK